jgi:hypothetical protein
LPETLGFSRITLSGWSATKMKGTRGEAAKDSSLTTALRGQPHARRNC